MQLWEGVSLELPADLKTAKMLCFGITSHVTVMMDQAWVGNATDQQARRHMDE